MERDAKTLKEALEEACLSKKMRLFLEEMLARYPDQDIRYLLAAARRRERSERRREEFT